MKKAGFWTKDWFLGRAAAIVLFLLAGSDLARKTYDVAVRAADWALAERIAL